MATSLLTGHIELSTDLSKDAAFSVGHPRDPLQHSLLQASVLGVRRCGKMNPGITSPSLVTTPNTLIGTGCLVFINMTILFEGSDFRNIFPELSSLGGDNFSFITRHLTDGLQVEHS